MKTTLFYRYWTASFGRILFLSMMLTLSIWGIILTPDHSVMAIFSAFYIGVTIALSSNLNPAWRATREEMNKTKSDS
jgi:hypothetical protein